MERRAKTQFWMEFIIDTLSLILSYSIAIPILTIFTNKISGANPTIMGWISYFCILAISFVASFFLFHRSIDLRQRNRLVELINIFINNSLIFMIFMSSAVFMRNNLLSIRTLLLFAFALFYFFSAIGRYNLKRWLTGGFSSSRNPNASFVGVLTTIDRAEEFVSSLKEDWSLKITGVALLDNFVENERFIYDDELEIGSEYANEKIGTKTKIRFPHLIADDIPVIATDNRFMDWIRSTTLDEVFINLPYANSDDVKDIVEELETMGITVHLNVPTLDNILDESNFDNINCKVYAGYPIATFSAAVHSSTGLALKRAFDIICAIVGIILSIPIIAITAIPLLIESPGPLFFKQERVGRNGRTFNIYKLRSMYKDAEARKAELMEHNKMDGLMFKMDNDPRITKVGRVIRKLSIDELPQFFNVLKGDMSLIGTRPPTVKEFEQYESRHKRRLSMRPGITGMWQVSGRSDIQDFEEVVRLDCQYIDNWSPWLDVTIFFKTIKVVLTHEGAE